jgi:putative ABC transport system permease protein
VDSGVSGVLYLAWRYLAWHRWKSCILVVAITLVLYLPLGLQLVVEQTAHDLNARANATPLVLGGRGSPLELVLNALYFSAERPPALPYSVTDELRQSALVDPVPLYVRYHSQGIPIVGTSLDYFTFRQLEIAHGRQLATLGEAVLGASAAQRLGVGVGDSVVSSPESVFDIAGVYPLKMPVVGILARAYSPDDNAIFVDLKTAWIIEGIGHGHQQLNSPAAASAVLKTDDDRIVANASLVQYNEINADNIESFHFHGDTAQLPLTAILPMPRSDKARVLIQGRYQAHEQLQLLQPGTVIEQLLDTVFAVQRYILVGMALVAVATAAVVLLVFMLSWRARQPEQDTLFRLGGTRPAILTLMLAEVVMVMLAAMALAAALAALTNSFGRPLLQAIIL